MTWRCLRTGDCCSPGQIQMTRDERRVLETAATRLGLTLQWRAGDRPRFTQLVARPCPFLARDDDGQAVCRVYEDRPYNCRRFMCGRFDTTERYDKGASKEWGIPLRVLRSEELTAEYAANLKDAQVWADAHGWRPSWPA